MNKVVTYESIWADVTKEFELAQNLKAHFVALANSDRINSLSFSFGWNGKKYDIEMRKQPLKPENKKASKRKAKAVNPRRKPAR